MKKVRTLIAVTGFSEAEGVMGIPDLMEEFGQRPWLLSYDARWVVNGSKLVITVESEGDSLEIKGGTTGAILDELWDCVIACMNFSSEEIQFQVEESRFVGIVDDGDQPRQQ